MATRFYFTVADRHPGEANWSILFPDFPGVTSVATRFADVPRQATDALASAIEFMVENGMSLPPAVEDGAEPVLPEEVHEPRLVAVPVEVPIRQTREHQAE